MHPLSSDLLVFLTHRVVNYNRARRCSWGTIVLSQKQTERSRTILSFQKKNERKKRVLKNIGTIYKGRERNGNCLKEHLKSETLSYYQERVLSWERILNQERVLNHLEIIII